MTTAEWFESTDKKIQANPAAINGIKGTFQFDYTADGQGIWFMIIPGDGTYKMGAGELPDAQVKVATKWSTMWDIMTDKLNANMAIMTGKMKFKGEMKVLLQLTAIVAL